MDRALDSLQERDPAKANIEQGLYRKFDVRRTDGSDQPGGKHDGCEYFVLDVAHDPAAKHALATYADAIQATHPDLASDMRERYALASPHPAAQGEAPAYGIIDPDYARVFTIARCLAWAEGYALAMQGSFTRDLDLLAAPWTNAACEPEHLARRIEDAAGLRITATSRDDEKPHGRLVWTLKFKTFGDPRFVDLSIMPRTTPPPAPAADHIADAGRKGETRP